ncbi:hypothetical protein TH63_13310 [Rufibacter radiotolerans]|uniref:Uncharacterized protein n=1 Tax=Rufibacter radiotolerans TaxID=1379910 RepID=A0A0H4VM22_9BACT|nr:carboxypeptidase-like regulatory domain-containing protein [Rufibacter radiotolerans]AKQ46378.1 hypothetical protein TH63_13310 [Rufibacter radiotolerans]
MKKNFPQILFLLLLSPFLAAAGQAMPRPEKGMSQTATGEQVHVRFSQPFYASGDTIKFKAFVVKTGSLQASAGSSVLEVAFKTSSAATTQHLRFPIVQGMAIGNIVLADSLARGLYEVTASTSSQAGEKEGVFRQRIRVLGPANERARADQPLAVTSVTLDAFPEGGKLIAGVENKLALKTTDQNGTGTAATGKITAPDGTATKFQTDHHGQGFMLFTPREGVSYQLALENQKAQGLLKLPPVQAQGVALRVTSSSDSLLQIRLLPSPAWLKNAAGKKVQVTFAAGGKPFFTGETTLAKGEESVMRINQQTLPDGPLKLTVTNANGQVEAERYMFVRHPQQLRLKVKTDRMSYGRREPVRVTAQVTDASGVPVEASLSFVVRSRAQAQSTQGKSLEEEFIKGVVPAYLLSASAAGLAPQSALEWSLLVEGAPSLLPTVKTPEPLAATTSQSAEGLRLAGRLLDAKGNALPSAMVLLFSRASSEPMVQVTDPEGRFSFLSLDFNNPGHYVTEVLSGGSRVKNATIEWADGPAFSPTAALPLRVTEQEAQYLRQAAVRAQTQTLFNGKKPMAVAEATDTSEAVLLGELGKPNQSYDLSKYNPFKNLEDVLRETVPLASVVGTGPDKEVRIFSPEKAGARFPERPLYLVNGTPVSNNEWLLNMPGAAIKQIDLFYAERKLSNIGLIGRYGVLSITTNPPHPSPREMQDKNSFTWAGLAKPFAFKTPSYEYTVPRPAPDFRSLLHWAPTVQSNANGTATVVFYTSDDIGDFEVEVEAYHPKGLVGSQRQLFTIVPTF